MAQSYETDVAKEFVLLGNDLIFQCKIPSFVADFVTVINWVTSEGDLVASAQGKLESDSDLWEASITRLPSRCPSNLPQPLILPYFQWSVRVTQ